MTLVGMITEMVKNSHQKGTEYRGIVNNILSLCSLSPVFFPGRPVPLT
jgi:predicted restriction endonuclease